MSIRPESLTEKSRRRRLHKMERNGWTNLVSPNDQANGAHAQYITKAQHVASRTVLAVTKKYACASVTGEETIPARHAVKFPLMMCNAELAAVRTR